MILLFNITNELCKMHAVFYYFKRFGTEFFTNADNFSIISKVSIVFWTKTRKFTRCHLNAKQINFYAL